MTAGSLGGDLSQDQMGSQELGVWGSGQRPLRVKRPEAEASLAVVGEAVNVQGPIPAATFASDSDLEAALLVDSKSSGHFVLSGGVKLGAAAANQVQDPGLKTGSRPPLWAWVRCRDQLLPHVEGGHQPHHVLPVLGELEFRDLRGVKVWRVVFLQGGRKQSGAAEVGRGQRDKAEHRNTSSSVVHREPLSSQPLCILMAEVITKRLQEPSATGRPRGTDAMRGQSKLPEPSPGRVTGSCDFPKE